jgi:hypothetical protein
MLRSWRAISLLGVLLLPAASAWAQAASPADRPVIVAQAPAPAASAAPPASAAESKGPNTGRLSLSGGADWASAYFFRGIRQETDGFILQPYGELAIKLVEGAGPLSSLSLSVGTWNSLHTGGASGAGCDACSDPKAWYESDFIVKLGATFFEDFTAGLVYTAYMSPNDLFGTVHELAVSLGYNDGKLLGPFALNPSLLLAFELDGQADAGDSKGVYLQLGVSPGYTFLADSRYPLTLSLPVALGLSVNDYYEFGGSDNPAFGYVQWGPAASVPLAFIPAEFGKWQLKGSLSFLHLGKTLERVNDHDAFHVLGMVGIALSY